MEETQTWMLNDFYMSDDEEEKPEYDQEKEYLEYLHTTKELLEITIKRIKYKLARFEKHLEIINEGINEAEEKKTH